MSKPKIFSEDIEALRLVVRSNRLVNRLQFVSAFIILTHKTKKCSNLLCARTILYLTPTCSSLIHHFSARARICYKFLEYAKFAARFVISVTPRQYSSMHFGITIS